MSLLGEGIDHTEIYMTNNVNSQTVFQTADSLLQTSTNIGLGGAKTPTRISITNMNITQTTLNGDVIQLNRCDHVKFENVLLKGPWVNGNGNAANTAAIRISSFGNVYPCSNISIINSKLTGTVYGVISKDSNLLNNVTTYVTVINTEFNTVWLGFTGDHDLSFCKISSSTFLNIDTNCISSTGANNIVSIGNNFVYTTISGGIFPIYWDATTTNCSSIGDSFANPNGNATNIFNANPSYNLILDAAAFNGATVTQRPLLLLDNQISPANTSVNFDLDQVNSIIMDYTIVRGSSYKIGRLQIISNGTTAAIFDNGNNLASDPGVVWGVTVTGTAPKILTLTYTTTTTGQSATVKWVQYQWHN